MARPTPLSGFPELLPAQRHVEQQVLARLARTFELHGFANVETRAVEPLDQLLTKGRPPRRSTSLQPPPGRGRATRGLGLHFDLTVPFARYVLENAGKLEFPFRRYQIQKVWRGERPAGGPLPGVHPGRHRRDRSRHPAFHHDVEVARVMVDALRGLASPSIGLPGFMLQVNNRKLIQGFYTGLGVADTAAVMRAVDKLDKLTEDAGPRPARSRTRPHRRAGRQLPRRSPRISTRDTSFVEQVRALGVRHELLDEGLTELAAVVEGCAALVTDRVEIVADLKIARGLDYYTGTVFETRLPGHESLGSICSGGRYDALASRRAHHLSGSRHLARGQPVARPAARPGIGHRRPLGARARSSWPSSTRSPRHERRARRAAARTTAIPCEVAPAAAEVRQADPVTPSVAASPTCSFPGADGAAAEIKDIRSGDQAPVDVSTWTPPVEDLRPRITPPTEEQHQ